MFAAILLALPAGARAATPGAQELLAQLESADPSLQTYRANVEFSVGLRSFPFLHKVVHGDAYFKRPGRMEIVFRDLPGFAQRFSNVYVGLGTPADWEKKFEIDTAQAVMPDGRAVTYLVLTPRKADHRLQHVAVYIDPASSLPNRITWTYRDGAIEMKQDIVLFNGHNVIAAQNADIRLPGVHAYVNAKIANYAINVPVDDAVFTKKL
ncbi:MAG: hypothetical protein NVSMB64_14690 [Candidatus Velthaea sp.]